MVAGIGPVGVAVSLRESLLISLDNTLNWMWSNEAFDNDLLHAFKVGIGVNLES